MRSWLGNLLSWLIPRPTIRHPSQAGPVAPFDESELVRMHNAERLKRGNLPPLRADALLSSIAARRAASAAAASLGADHLHDGFKQLAIPGATRTGENAAIGQADADAVMETWMTSAGHRANILEPDYSRMGAARSTSKAGVTYWYCLFAG